MPQKQAKRAQRQAKQQAKAQDRLMSVATPKAIRREAKAATRQEYQPITREIKAEKRASKLQQGRIGDYFGEYGTTVDDAAKRTADAYSGATATIQGTSDSAAKYAEELRSKLASEDQANAQLRGASYDSEGSQTNAAAQLARINSANTLIGVNASQGATQQAYLSDKKAIGSREEIEQHLREAARKRSLNKDLRDVAKDKGTYKVAKLAELKDRERDFGLSQQAATASRRSDRKAQALTAKGQKITAKNAKRSAKVTARNARLSAQTQRRGQNITARGQDITAANNRADNARADRDSRSTRQDRAHDNAHPNAGDAKSTYTVGKAVSVIREHERNPTKGDKFTSEGQAVDYLVAHGYSRKVAQRAVSQLLGGNQPSGGPQRGA
jgi:hypothetical protein